MRQQNNPRNARQWVLLPLRLFLGITFVYAGFQKLTDPQFLQPTSAGYVGKQIASFAASSPLHDFLTQVVMPHITFFGLLVIYGEIAIGLATLLGLLLRPAAFFGLLLSGIFFLTASWRVYPYFYGSDLVFAFCWLTLLLNGPQHTGLPAIDELIVQQLSRTSNPHDDTRLASFYHVLLGINESSPVKFSSADEQPQIQRTRRSFLFGMLTGSASMIAFATAIYSLRFMGRQPVTANAGNTDDNAAQMPTPIPADTTTATDIIAQVSAVQKNSAVNFTIPSTGDPGILVRLNNGQFVAYDALCTHAGCQLDYDTEVQMLSCPCHGASFDPAKAGMVTAPPAHKALSAVAIHIDSATGAITLA